MTREWDREEYERWHRLGKERGWFDKTRDEVASWFGDEDAERRRRFDERERVRREGREGRYSSEHERSDLPRSDWERPISARYASPYTGAEYGSGTRYGRDYELGREARYGTGGRDLEHQSMYGTGREIEFFNAGGRSLGSPAATDVYGQQRQVLGRQMRGGRGPRNYRRMDERILDDVHERLDRHPEIDAREIEVEVKNAEVILKGTVCDRRDKRLAEDLADDVFGVKNVQNLIRVAEEHSLERTRQETTSASPNPLKR